jgi:predicted GTPase
MAEAEADVIVWDGGNNDFPFVRPGLHVVVADALRPRQVATHHPGETVARMADVFVLNKVDSASSADVQVAEAELQRINPRAPIVRAQSPIRLDDAQAVKGRRVLVVEDGPTITHGGMPYGAGYLAAINAGADIVDPRLSADVAMQAVFEAYPHIGKVLPVDLVIAATPADLARLLRIEKKVVRARYAFAETGEPRLSTLVDAFVDRAVRRST